MVRLTRFISIPLLAVTLGVLGLVAGPGQGEAVRPPRPAQQQRQQEVQDKTRRDFDQNCLSAGCHAQILTMPWSHGPVAVGACSACHKAVGEVADHKFEYTQPRDELCDFCHQLPARDQAKETAKIHEPYATGECEGCHGSHGGHTRFILTEPTVGALCSSCHDDQPDPETGRVVAGIQDEIADAEFLHGPVAEGDCAACHPPHASENERLLTGQYSGEFYIEWSESSQDFCFKCHDPRLASEEATDATAFRDGERNLHYVHLNRDKGRNCVVCHAVHGANQEKLLRRSVAFGPGGWQLPIGFERTAEGGSCAAGCHRKMSYDNTGGQ